VTDEPTDYIPDPAAPSASPERATVSDPDSPTGTAADSTDEQGGFARWLLETVLMVALAFLLAQGIKTFIVQPFVIPTGSMEPTIMTGDRVLAEKISYRFGSPQQGEIVVFDDPMGQHPQLIKRVIAVGGQTIDIREGRVYIDDQLIDEPYVHGVETQPGTEAMPLTVPEGEVWLMGDNRPNSGDSRYIGPQPVDSIRGRAFAIYWPIGRIGSLR